MWGARRAGAGSNVRDHTNEHAVFLLTLLLTVIGKGGGLEMGKLPFIAAVAGAMWALPAFAGDGGSTIPSKSDVTPAQFQFCVGPDCGERDRVYRERRYYGRDDDDWRYRHGDNWRYYRDGACRDVTIRERRGDEVVIRHQRRCD